MDKKTADKLKDMLKSIYKDSKDNRAQKFLIEVFNKDESEEQDLSALESLLLSSDLLAAIDADSSVYNLCLCFLSKKADIDWYSFALTVCDGSDTVQMPEYCHDIEKCFNANIPIKVVIELYRNSKNSQEFSSKAELLLPVSDNPAALKNIISDISDIREFINTVVYEKIEEKDQEISSLKEKVDSIPDLNSDISALKSERDEYIILYKKADLTSKKLESKLNTLTYRLSISGIPSMNEKVKSLERENSSYKIKCSDLEEQISNLKEEIKGLKDSAEDKNSQDMNLMLQVDDVYKENEFLSSELEKIKADYEALKIENDLLKSQTSLPQNMAPYISNDNTGAYPSKIVNGSVPVYSDMNRERAVSVFNGYSDGQPDQYSEPTDTSGTKQYMIVSDSKDVSQKKNVFKRIVENFQRSLFRSKSRNDQVSYLARIVSKSEDDYEKSTLIKKCFDIQPPEKLDNLYDLINSHCSVADLTAYIRKYSGSAVA